MEIRHARMDDLNTLFKIGQACYSPEEAISEAEYAKRISEYPNHFWIFDDFGEVLAFIVGPVIDEPKIEDALFRDPTMHRENGAWQAILGVNTDPRHQNRGYAALVMNQLISDAKVQGRKGCALSCKKELIPYYERFGFENTGVSSSALAGQIWYDMVLKFF